MRDDREPTSPLHAECRARQKAGHPAVGDPQTRKTGSAIRQSLPHRGGRKKGWREGHRAPVLGRADDAVISLRLSGTPQAPELRARYRPTAARLGVPSRTALSRPNGTPQAALRGRPARFAAARAPRPLCRSTCPESGSSGFGPKGDPLESAGSGPCVESHVTSRARVTFRLLRSAQTVQHEPVHPETLRSVCARPLASRAPRPEVSRIVLACPETLAFAASRMRGCQGWGRGFESLRPLQSL